MIKAIQTEYKGDFFRSRIEARWAVFFRALGVEYVYEKEGYQLTPSLRYLPDFWLPKQKCWVEIKGTEPTENEKNKCALLAEGTGKDAWIFSGNIGEEKCDSIPELGLNWFGTIYETWGVVGSLDTYFNDQMLSYWCATITDFIRSKQGKQGRHKFEDWIPPEMEIKTIKDIQRVVVIDKQYYYRRYGKLPNYYSFNHLRLRKSGYHWDRYGKNGVDILHGARYGNLNDSISQAYRAARSARFEHGETP